MREKGPREFGGGAWRNIRWAVGHVASDDVEGLADGTDRLIGGVLVLHDDHPVESLKREPPDDREEPGDGPLGQGERVGEQGEEARVGVVEVDRRDVVRELVERHAIVRLGEEFLNVDKSVAWRIGIKTGESRV